MSKAKHLHQAGFTLIEMIVVMVIVAVLAGIMLVNFQDARTRTRDSVRKADLRQVKSALQLYYNDSQVFPASTSTYDPDSEAEISANGSTITDACGDPAGECDWGSSFTVGETVYMSSLPIDPLNIGNHQYTYLNINSDSYLLLTFLENVADQDAAKSQAKCLPGADVVEGLYVLCHD